MICYDDYFMVILYCACMQLIYMMGYGWKCWKDDCSCVFFTCKQAAAGHGRLPYSEALSEAAATSGADAWSAHLFVWP